MDWNMSLAEKAWASDAANDFSDCQGSFVIKSDTMEFDILIKDGIIVNHDREYQADVGIKESKIVEISEKLEPGSKTDVIDAKGCYVIPGIDPHVHMELPVTLTVSADDFCTGSQAALSGGTTMLMDFAHPNRGDSMIDAYNSYRKRADEKCCMDYGLHMGLTSWDEDRKKDLRTLIEKHGINSIKFYMAYRNLMVNDSEILDILSFAKECGAIAQVHCENGDMVEKGQERMLKMGITGPAGHPLSRPPEVEAEATSRVCRLANFVGCPLYVVHVMCEAAMKEVLRAKRRGQRVIGETLTNGLALDDSHYFHEDFEHAAKYIMSPPLRPKGNQKALKNALKNGVLDLIGTDHCSFNMEQRRLGKDNFCDIPNGLHGVEDRMNICWNELVNIGVLSRSDFVRVTSTEAAQIFNIYPQKGCVGVGSDADIAIINPLKKRVISAKTHHQNIDYNVFEGYKLNGYVTKTISRGKLVWDDGKLMAVKGAGKFIPTPPFGKMFNGLTLEEQSKDPMKLIIKKREEAMNKKTKK